MENYVITISRKFGSNGHAIAGEVGRLLGIPVYDRSAVEAMVSQLIPGTESVSDDLNLTDTSEPVQKTDTGEPGNCSGSRTGGIRPAVRGDPSSG